jgi:hypothetical protein
MSRDPASAALGGVKIRATGFMAELHDHAPGFDHLIRICRPQRDQARDGAQGRQMFHRLAGGPILSDADGIVGEGVDHRNSISALKRIAARP